MKNIRLAEARKNQDAWNEIHAEQKREATTMKCECGREHQVVLMWNEPHILINANLPSGTVKSAIPVPERKPSGKAAEILFEIENMVILLDSFATPKLGEFWNYQEWKNNLLRKVEQIYGELTENERDR